MRTSWGVRGHFTSVSCWDPGVQDLTTKCDIVIVRLPSRRNGFVLLLTFDCSINPCNYRAEYERIPSHIRNVKQ